MNTRRREGSIIVLQSVGMLALMLVIAMVVDVGYWYSRRASLQVQADTAAMGGLGTINPESSYATQVAHINSVVTAMTATNGLPANFWTVTCQGAGVSPTLVTTVTVKGVEQASAFFFRVVGVTTVPIGVLARAEAEKVQQTSPPCGFFAKDDIEWGGGGSEDGIIDSYNSTNGAYTANATFGDKPYNSANAAGCANDGIYYNGNVAQFGSLFGYGTVDITGGAALIDGDLTSHGGINANRATITGTINEYTDIPRLQIPDATAPADIATNNSNGCCAVLVNTTNGSTTPTGTNLNVSSANREVQLQAGGTYYFSAIDLTGQVPMKIVGDPDVAGKTRIYLAGNSRMLGGVTFGMDQTGQYVNATDLEIIGLGGAGTELEIGGGSTMFADIYAPNMDFELHGNSHLLGRIYANDIDFSGLSHFSFDEALGYRQTATVDFDVRVHLIQ